MESKLEIIKKLIKEQIYDETIDINEETNLIDLIGWDDLDTAELSVSIEDIFDIEFTDEEYDEINNIGKLIELIETKTK